MITFFSLSLEKFKLLNSEKGNLLIKHKEKKTNSIIVIFFFFQLLFLKKIEKYQ